MAFYLSKALVFSTCRIVCLRSRKLKVLATERVPSGVLSLLALPATVHLRYRYLSSSCTKYLPKKSSDSGSFLPEVIAKPDQRGKVSRRDQPIIQQIPQFSNTSDLLSFLETVDPNELDQTAVELISDVLWQTLKNEPYASGKKLLKSIGMQIYCGRILKTCGTMDGGQLIMLIRLFVFMGANGDHDTFQTLLRLISEQASTLELLEIVFLNFLMESLRHKQTSTLSDTIRAALPEVFESNATLQLNDAEPEVLIECLAFSLKNKCRDGMLTKIIDKILSLRPSDFSLAQAMDIQKCCADHWPPITGRLLNEKLQSLLELSYGIFTANMHTIDEHQMSEILETSASGVREGHLEFYHEHFFDACCSRIADSSNESQVLRFLSPMCSLRHVSIKLLERCAEIAARDPQRTLNNGFLYSDFIRGFSHACYQPKNWNILQPMLLEHPATNRDMSDHRQSNLIRDYLALDTLPVNLLERFFSTDYFDTLDAWLLKRGPLSLILIYAAIKQLHPEYSGPLPPKSMIEAWQEASRTESETYGHPLKGSFITAYGAENVVTGLTHEGMHIDHCMVIGNGGYPVAVQQCQYSCLDEIERPPGSTLVLVKGFTIEAYSLNTRRLRGVYSLKTKILKSFGYPVVEVDLMAWQDLPAAQKIPYLVKKVRESVNGI